MKFNMALRYLSSKSMSCIDLPDAERVLRAIKAWLWVQAITVWLASLSVLFAIVYLLKPDVLAVVGVPAAVAGAATYLAGCIYVASSSASSGPNKTVLYCIDLALGWGAFFGALYCGYLWYPNMLPAGMAVWAGGSAILGALVFYLLRRVVLFLSLLPGMLFTELVAKILKPFIATANFLVIWCLRRRYPQWVGESGQLLISPAVYSAQNSDPERKVFVAEPNLRFQGLNSDGTPKVPHENSYKSSSNVFQNYTTAFLAAVGAGVATSALSVDWRQGSVHLDRDAAMSSVGGDDGRFATTGSALDQMSAIPGVSIYDSNAMAMDVIDINPASGLPMVAGVGSVDVMGNSYGSDDSWNNTGFSHDHTGGFGGSYGGGSDFGGGFNSGFD